MKELRDQLDLTRPQLAQATGRSVGYILKAEQYTFPRAPVALTAYYSHRLNIPVAQLNLSYRDAQRHKREQFYEVMIPRDEDTGAASLCNKWQLVTSGAVGFSGDNPPSPNQYQVSKTLCVPASAVYFAEHNGKISAAILEAMDDILAFTSSGRLYSLMSDYDQAQLVHIGLERINKELRNGV